MKSSGLLFLLLLLANPVKAATIPVGGPDGCSLANAIRSANDDASRGNCTAGNGTDIIVTPDNWSVSLDGRLPTIDSSLFIRTETDSGLLTISGSNQHQIMRVSGSDTTLTLERVALIDSNTGSGSGRGVAAINIRDASVFIFDSEFRDNQGDSTSAIWVEDGVLGLDQVQVSSSSSQHFVTAIASSVSILDTALVRNYLSGSLEPMLIARDQSDLDIDNSLFDSDSGIEVNASSASLINSTVTGAGRTSIPSGIEVINTSTLFLGHATLDRRLKANNAILSLVNSFIDACSISNSNFILNTGNFNRSDNCLGDGDGFSGLLPLTDNGGPTQTRALPLNSGLIDAADQAFCQANDQRGVERIGLCDIGAYELATTADIETTLNISPSAPYISDQTIAAVLQVTNNGPGLATSIDIDLDTTRVSIQAIESSACTNFPCQISSMVAGQTLSFFIELRVGDSVNNNFEIEASALSTPSSVHQDLDEASTSSNNRASFIAPISPGADILVDMALITPPPYSIGQVLSYQAVIKNSGPQTATGVDFDLVLENMDIQSFGGCTSSSGLSCNVANIANEGSRTIMVETKTTATPFDAIATVSADQIDIDLDNNVDALNNGGGITTTDISVEMALLTPPPRYSDQILQYEITLFAQQAASGLQLDFDFPDAGFADIEGCVGFPCDLAFDLNTGQSTTLTALFFAPFGPVERTFSVTVIPAQTETDLSNNTAAITTTFVAAADIRSSLTLVTQPPYVSGQDIVYDLVISNDWVSDANNVEIDLLPENLSLQTVIGQQCQTISCLLDQLDRFAEENITLVYRILGSGEFDLQASAFADEFDPQENNNIDNSNNGGIADQDVVFDQIFNGNFESEEF